MDPQSHCALGLAVPETQIEHSITDMLRAGLNGSLAFSDCVWQISRHLDLAPSTMALAGVEQELSGAPDKDRRLAQVLSTVQDSYEFCIIDCPPSVGLLTFNALRACDEVIVPVETGYFAMQGSFKQEATIEMLVRRTGHHVRHKVLATMYDVRTKLAREILSELRKHFGEKLLPLVINFNSKLKEAASFGQPITEYDPASRGMQDFEKLAGWLISNPPEPSPEMVREAQASNPALSRAAELVERARALSARTAALAAKIASDPHVIRTGAMDDVEAAPMPTPQIPAAPQQAAPPPRQIADRLAHLRKPGAAPLQTHHEPDDSAHGPTQTATATATRLSRVYGVRKTSQGVLFVQPLAGAAQVSVAGDFNNWSATATPLKRDDQLGVWQACVPIAPGRYRYRLLVDGQWKPDPHNTFVETNPFGELNSILEVA